MSYFQAFVLGLIQGLTEFLPVSSSGHLVLFSRITGVESSLYFDLILHLGTLAAVIIALRRELTGLIRKPFSAPSLSLALATAVSAAVVALLYKPAKLAFSGGKTLPVFFMLTAVLLTVGAYYRPETVKPRHDFFTAAVVGFCQGLAVFPGLSRSGTTVTAGALAGVEKRENTAFCFILSVPIILGSALVEIIGGEASPVPVGQLLTGFFTAFISGLLSLKLAKTVFAKNNGVYFAAYLAVLSAVIVINDLWLHLF